MKVGDLIVHIGAKPNGYRIRLACAFETVNSKSSKNNFIADREIIIFEDGLYDFKDQWRVFTGWSKYEIRKFSERFKRL